MTTARDISDPDARCPSDRRPDHPQPGRWRLDIGAMPMVDRIKRAQGDAHRPRHRGEGALAGRNPRRNARLVSCHREAGDDRRRRRSREILNTMSANRVRWLPGSTATICRDRGPWPTWRRPCRDKPVGEVPEAIRVTHGPQRPRTSSSRGPLSRVRRDLVAPIPGRGSGSDHDHRFRRRGRATAPWLASGAPRPHIRRWGARAT